MVRWWLSTFVCRLPAYIPFFKHIVILSLLHSWYPFTLLCCFFNNLFLKIFFMCTILKVYWVCYNTALLFTFWSFGQKACGIFSSPSRDRTHAPCSGRWSPNHWTTREVPSCFNYIGLSMKPFNHLASISFSHTDNHLTCEYINSCKCVYVFLEFHPFIW